MVEVLRLLSMFDFHHQGVAMLVRTSVLSVLFFGFAVTSLPIDSADAQTFQQRGTRQGAVAGAIVGGLIGGALEPIAANALGTLAIAGQFEIDLATSQTFAAGAAVYADAESKAHASAGSFFGWAVAAHSGGKVKAVLVQTVGSDVS
jgi:predicted RecA/RadA family phage recombinase